MHLHISDAGTRRITPEIAAGRRVARDALKHYEVPADRFDVLRDVAKIRKQLGLSPVALRVLNIFVGLLKPAELASGMEPIARPSNKYLEKETGYSISSLKRAFNNLLAAGLILEKRSANGKRFARKSPEGFIRETFGFDLSPLFARAGELRILAQRADAEAMALREARQDFSRYRIAIEAELAACQRHRLSGEWQEICITLEEIISSTPLRNGDIREIETANFALQGLLTAVENLRLSTNKPVNMNPNGVQNELHIQDTNPDVFHSRRNKRSSANAPHHNPIGAASGTNCLQNKAGAEIKVEQAGKTDLDPNIELSLVRFACPSVENWTKGAFMNWDTFTASARGVLFPLLGIGQHAWEKAVSVMGEQNATIATALVLERLEANQIQTTAGAYFTAMIDRARENELRLHASLMKLAKDRENDRG